LRTERSIQHKLTQAFFLTSAAALLLMFASYFLYELFSYRQNTIRQLEILGSIIASNSTAALAFDSPADAQEILSALKSEPNIERACLYDVDGQIFSVYPDSVSASSFPESHHATGFDYNNNSLEGFISVEQNAKKLGTLFIKRNTDDILQRLILYTLIMIGIMTFCFLLTYFLSKQFQRAISTPIIALSHTSRLISQKHDYSLRATKMSDDEIGSLTDAFNKMLAQIEIQNGEIQAARRAALQHAMDLEVKVNERTLEIKQQKDFAEAVVNSSFVLIAVFDTNLRFIAFNRKCEEEFGLKREQVLGKEYLDVMPVSKGSPTHQALLKALQGEIVHNTRFVSNVSREYYESYTVPLRNQKNEIYAILLTAHNITEIVEASEKIGQANLELQRKNAELEQFAYVASHDLQEPLRKIQTFIQMANETKDGQAARRYLDKIHVSAERMSSLIKDLLEYSRLSQPQEHFHDTDLNTILDYVLADFELLITQKNAVIRSDKLPIIQGNKLQLHQLFANLINNAIKFNEEKPEISITYSTPSPEEVRFIDGLDPGRTYARLVFSDNGIGFEQQHAEKIFTIFQRLNPREKFEGTGIGLALCKKIVENHNGHIAVKSTPKSGTDFIIFLPVHQ
jgi:PAS domain S-box-containing protein